MNFVVVKDENILEEISKGTELFVIALDFDGTKKYIPLQSKWLRTDATIFKKKTTVTLFDCEVQKPLTEDDIKSDDKDQYYYIASLNRPDYVFGPVSPNSLSTYIKRNIVFRTEKDAQLYAKVISKKLQEELINSN